jgi:hypothetical protein
MGNKWVWIIIKGGSGFLSAILVFALWSYIHFGAVAYGLAWLRGEQLVIEPQEIDLGEVGCEQRRKLSFEVINLGGEPIRLIGANSSCACMVTEGIPTTVPAHSTCTLVTMILTPSETGEFTQHLIIYSELESQTFLIASISGRAVGKKG